MVDLNSAATKEIRALEGIINAHIDGDISQTEVATQLRTAGIATCAQIGREFTNEIIQPYLDKIKSHNKQQDAAKRWGQREIPSR